MTYNDLMGKVDVYAGEDITAGDSVYPVYEPMKHRFTLYLHRSDAATQAIAGPNVPIFTAPNSYKSGDCVFEPDYASPELLHELATKMMPLKNSKE